MSINTEDFNTRINNRIKQLQLQRNWSVYHLALESGISAATILNWFNRKATPSINLLEKICNAFGITLAQFFNESDDVIELTEQDKELLREWVLLHAAEKDAILNLIKTMNDKAREF